MAQTKTKKALQKAGKEMKDRPPRVLAQTAKKYGEKVAEKQRKAILLAKARKAGAKVPPPKKRSTSKDS
jgi:hypothetical protein